jgi:hypothetical protein
MSICSTAAPHPLKRVAVTASGTDGLQPLLVPIKAAFKALGVKPTKGWRLVKEGKIEVVHDESGRCFAVTQSIEQRVENLRAAESTRPRTPRAGLEQAIAASLATRKERTGQPRLDDHSVSTSSDKRGTGVRR